MPSEKFPSTQVLENIENALTDWTARRNPLFQDAAPTETFLRHARQAAEAARHRHAMHELGRAVDTMGFHPLPLPEFLATAARMAHLNPERLLSPPAGRSPIFSWIGLAKAVGLQSKRLATLVRLWVAEREMHAAAPHGLLARGRGVVDFLFADIEAEEIDENSICDHLDQLEAGYRDAGRDLLASCLAEVNE